MDGWMFCRRYVGSKSGTVNIGALDLKSSGSSLSTFAARSVKIPVERPDVAVKRRVRTLYQCHADGLQELSFEPNEIITNGKGREGSQSTFRDYPTDLTRFYCHGQGCPRPRSLP